MKLHFLGTTGYHPNNHRQTACLMLPEIGVIFDAGTGMFRVRDLIQTESLDIFLSHVHLDHSIGLTFLFDILYQKDVEQVRVHCDPEKARTLKEHLFNPTLFPAIPDFEFVDLKPKLELPSGQTLTTFPLQHPGGSHGFRMESEHTSLAYVTDTTARPNADYIRHIRSVKTLIHECYFVDGWEEQAELTGHSCLTPVAQVAKGAEAEVCYLVHINPLIDQEPPFDLSPVHDIFPQLQFSHDHMIIDV